MTDPMRCSHCASEVPPGSALCLACTAPLDGAPQARSIVGVTGVTAAAMAGEPAAAAASALPPAASPAARCPVCGAEYDPSVRFCPADGSAIAAGPIAAQGARIAHNVNAIAANMEHGVEKIKGNFERLLVNGYTVAVGRYFTGAWSLFKKYPQGFLLYGLLVIALHAASAGAFFLCIYPLIAGISLVAHRLEERETPEFSHFFGGFNHFLPLFMGTLIAWIFIALGLLTCGILSIYLIVGYHFVSELILFRGLDFGPAMEASRKMVQKQWFEIFFFVLLLAVINLVGAITVLGLAFTIPYTVLATHVAFEEIFAQA